MDDEFLDPNDYYADQDDSRSRDSGTSSEVPQENLHRSIGWVVAALLFFAVVWVYSYPDWFSSSNSGANAGAGDQAEPIIVASKSPRSNTVSNKLEEITGLSLPIGETFDWATEEEAAANRSAVNELQTKLDAITHLLNSNSEDLALLQVRTESLRTSEEGARIASNSKFVRQYIALHEKISDMTSSPPVVDDFVKDMKAFLERVEVAKDTSYFPQQFVVDRAIGFSKSLKEKATELRKFDNAVNELIAQTSDLQAGPLLETAIKSQLVKMKRELAETLADAREDARKVKNIELAQAEKEKVEAEADFEKAKIVAGTFKARKMRDDLLAKAAKKKLEQEFNRDLNDVNAYLLPFISSGRNLRGNAAGKGPASFSAIKLKGALENTADGLASLSVAAKNGRPLGGFPEINIMAHMITNNSTPGSYHNTPKYRGIEAYLEKAQSLLKKYGPLMVEKGLLAK